MKNAILHLALALWTVLALVAMFGTLFGLGYGLLLVMDHVSLWLGVFFAACYLTIAFGLAHALDQGARAP